MYNSQSQKQTKLGGKTSAGCRLQYRVSGISFRYTMYAGEIGGINDLSVSQTDCHIKELEVCEYIIYNLTTGCSDYVLVR